MLPTKLRLTHLDFLKTKRNGHRLLNDNFSLTANKNDLDYSRYSVVTSAKVDKRAVVRNKLRRCIYNFLVNYPLAGYDVIIFPKPQVLKLPNEMVNIELNSLLSKLSERASRA